MIACDTCNDEGRVPWIIESDPNCYIEADAEAMIPCPDCDDALVAEQRRRPR